MYISTLKRERERERKGEREREGEGEREREGEGERERGRERERERGYKMKIHVVHTYHLSDVVDGLFYILVTECLHYQTDTNATQTTYRNFISVGVALNGRSQ